MVAAVRRITDPTPDSFGISQRSVTVSMVGLAPAIRKLADEGLQVTLVVSLHTPDDELRDTLVPVNTRWPIDEVLSAARYYAEVTGRRVSIEDALKPVEREFVRRVNAGGVVCMVRDTRGREIAAACGQLAAEG